MAVDGISKYATFFNDWQALAAEAAAAHQQLRELRADEVQASGLLHAFVEVHARGAIPAASRPTRRCAASRREPHVRYGEGWTAALEGITSPRTPYLDNDLPTK